MRRAAFADRRAAGRALAAAVVAQAPRPPVIVLGLPRGGVPVAVEVARALRAPLDVLLVRKIGAPWQPELAVAAVVEGTPAEVVVDERMCDAVGASSEWIAQQAATQSALIERRREAYGPARIGRDVAGATVIVVDDGIATGTTMRAALRALRRRRPARLVLAVPVGPADVLAALRAEVDDIVCLERPEPFEAVGCHYDDFHQVDDAEVLEALAEANGPASDRQEGTR